MESTETIATTEEAPGAGAKLPQLYGRFARSFGAPAWGELPPGAREAFLAAVAQVGHDHEDEQAHRTSAIAEPYLTLAEVAGLLHVSTATLYREVADSRLHAVMIRGARRVRRSELVRYLEAQNDRMGAVNG